jgi:hypothetical protein
MLLTFNDTQLSSAMNTANIVLQEEMNMRELKIGKQGKYTKLVDTFTKPSSAVRCLLF